jgi:nickel-dependent lactate racemase
MTVLRYGTDSSVHLESVNGKAPHLCGEPQGMPLGDLAAAVAAALDQPLDYPPLRQSTTAGDRVVVALGQGLPRAAEITAAVIHALTAAGVDPDGICVLRTEADVAAAPGDPRRLIEDSLCQRIRLLTHDPANRPGMAYLTANDRGEPIFLNRQVTDADLVLPIGRLQDESAAGCFGMHDSLYPAMSDYRTQARFRRLDLPQGGGKPHQALVHEVDQVAWLLGISFTVQMVPAAGDGVLHVLAGASEAVRRRSRELYRAAWACQVAHRASLVVAAIEGGPQQQTWENLGRALEAAVRLVEEGGTIALCCDLAAPPGAAVQCLRGARSRDTAMRQIRHDSLDDALPAAQLAHALDHGHVYLLSRLDAALVEDLEMVPIGDPQELGRLTRRHDSCILLANAPQAMVRITT